MLCSLEEWVSSADEKADQHSDADQTDHLSEGDRDVLIGGLDSGHLTLTAGLTLCCR